MHSSALVSMGNTFEDLLQSRETVDNTKRHIQCDIHIT
jgi:hypothetical protein